MATVNAGPAGPLNMVGLQIHNLQYGNVPIYDSGLVRVDNGGGRYVDFRGSFTYAMSGGGGGDPYSYDPYGGMGGYYSYDTAAAAPSDYYPVSGTVTQITEVNNGQITMDVTGLNAEAVNLFNLLQAKNIDGINGVVFGGGDAINGGPGGDSLDGWGGDDNINAGGGPDFVRALDGNDAVDGGAGDDDVNGNRGFDVVRGGEGNDWVRGGQENDTVFGDAGDDPHVNGNLGDDIVRGGTGNDTVFGGQGADQLFGEDGNDWLSGDLGNDQLTGGAGADRFLFRVGSGADVVLDFNGAEGDRVQLAPGTAYTLSTVGGSAVINLGPETLTVNGVAESSLSGWIVFG